MHKKWWAVVAILAVLGGLGGWAFWYNIYRTEPDPNANLSPDQHFLYGSIGTEGEEGIPYWVFLVLPKVFPEYLPGPGGYAALGLAWEPTHDLPAGLTHRTVGFERVGVNCAFCHVAAVRLTEDQPVPTFYPGAPGHQVHVQDYQRFLFQVASDPRFNSDVLLDAIGEITTLSAREKFLYRYLLIPQTRSALVQNKKDFTWAESRPLHGPGRLDPFDPVRFRFFKEKDDGSIGTVDIPPVWNQKPRVGMSLHWDGLTTKVHESAMTAAIGDGARQTYLDLPSLEKDEEYLLSTSPAKFPLPIDGALAERGSHLFAANCASCHAFGGQRVGTVVPPDEIGTDRHRTDSWTQSQVDGWKALAAEYRTKYKRDVTFDTFNKSSGYVSVPLDGIWLRGPYLHNGSVPNVRALLDPPSSRPAFFYRGNDVLDPVNLGFVTTVAATKRRQYFKFDTTLPGNGNGGHVYGTQLPDSDKSAIVEYLKTL